MGYQLPPHISFCRARGATILLDLKRDWYFQLDPLLEPTFDALIRGELNAANTQNIQRLVELGVIQDQPAAATQISAPTITAATQSWCDATPSPSPLSPAFLLDVWLAVRRARTQVRKIAFERLIDKLRDRKARQTPPRPQDAQAIRSIASRFSRARLAAPVDPICLQDSLALLEVLSLRRLSADLVIGVNTAPFQAHCWVQSGGLVLNEPLDRITAFQPILVV